jgi:acetyltransferase-like isoleucine patch superfamily enzyme
VKASRLKGALLSVFERARRACTKCLLRMRFLGSSVKIDPSSRISWRSIIRTTGGGSISIGRNCEIHAFAMILTYGGDIVIGDDCSLNPFAIVYGHGGVRIGNRVRIAAHSVIIPANHDVPVGAASLLRSGISMKGITIGNDVWIGSGARILDGVGIESNSVVGAGSVVTKSVPGRAIVAGVPARIIREH